MFVLTVDQVDSRGFGDRVGPLLPDLSVRWRDTLLLGPDRTAGDEFQLVAHDAAGVLGLVLELTRRDEWSVGLGIGDVDEPLPGTTREATGDAFVAARDAVERAKRTPHRFALTAASSAAPLDGPDVEALTDLLLEVRSRRSPEGWAVVDRLGPGTTQAAVAQELGITAQAVSLRARAAGIRLEARAVPALVRALEAVDGGRP
ncbi:DNA-binding protein [Amnibacterium sp.]|uniref:DNA-binding protein n=1 Tax=Amnibacterium sp. TaxID=1872496 RepID=UPI00262E5666|nr:DNA-binding protein [Amnibacterium sp.]MCU1472832.1 DNA-binding protein [Amnibacterium sp.]